jgi:hypothetical protein
MRLLPAFQNVLDVFGSFDFFRMSCRAGDGRIPIPPPLASAFFDETAFCHIKDLDFFFYSDDFNEIHFHSAKNVDCKKIMLDHKYIGSMVATAYGGEIGIYFEPLEEIGFVTGDVLALERAFQLSDKQLQEMTLQFRATLATLQNLRGHALSYVAKMRELTGIEV